MPRAWQPLKLSGTPDKGRMIVGDSQCAMFVVTWERPAKRGAVDGQRWVAERLRRHGTLPHDNPPCERRFTACGWAHDVQTEEGKMTTLWYGYAAQAPLFVGVTVNGVLPDELRDAVVRTVLPTLTVSPAQEPTDWAMYDVGFRVPAGFELAQRHLFSGDVALEFARGAHETLLVRQVYPGDLALGRRSSEAWLERYPFKEHRRLRRAALRVQPWRHASRVALAGIQRVAWKRLPVPLGWASPRCSRALAVRDEELNRLLIVEHMAKGEPSAEVCAAAIDAMNTELRERD